MLFRVPLAPYTEVRFAPASDAKADITKSTLEAKSEELRQSREIRSTLRGRMRILVT
jgi:hypothetical protein